VTFLTRVCPWNGRGRMRGYAHGALLAQPHTSSEKGFGIETRRRSAPSHTRWRNFHFSRKQSHLSSRDKLSRTDDYGNPCILALHQQSMNITVRQLHISLIVHDCPTPFSACTQRVTRTCQPCGIIQFPVPRSGTPRLRLLVLRPRTHIAQATTTPLTVARSILMCCP